MNSYVTPKSTADWKALLAQVRPDLGVGVFGRTAEFALALRSQAVPRVWMCLVCPWLSGSEGERARRANLLVYDNVIVPSWATAQALSAPVEVNVRRLGQGVDTELFKRASRADVASLKKQLQISEGDFVLGYAGRFSAEKNQSDLVAGLAELVRGGSKHAQPYQLILCGPPPTDRERAYAQGLLQQARKLKIEKRVHIHFIEHAQMPLWYSCYDVMVSLSSVETFGLSTIESLACGTPLIAVDNPAFGESLDFYPKQWLVAHPNRIWEQVRQLANGSVEVQELGKWAAKKVRQKRDLRISLQEHAEYFGELIARPTENGAIAYGDGTKPTELLT